MDYFINNSKENILQDFKYFLISFESFLNGIISVLEKKKEEQDEFIRSNSN
jgi:hypothetical protein